MLMLLHDSLNLIVSGVKLWTVVRPQLRRREVESFALQHLDSVEPISFCQDLGYLPSVEYHSVSVLSATLASAGISCHRVSVCPSVCHKSVFY